MTSYDSWKLASPYDDEVEWTEKFDAICEQQVSASEVCRWAGKVDGSCVGNEDDYSLYWQCPQCETEHEEDVRP